MTRFITFRERAITVFLLLTSSLANAKHSVTLFAVAKSDTFSNQWGNFKYNEVDLQQIIKVLNKQIDKHNSHKFVKKHYQQIIEELDD